MYPKYLDPTTDFGFKKLFSEEEITGLTEADLQSPLSCHTKRKSNLSLNPFKNNYLWRFDNEPNNC